MTHIKMWKEDKNKNKLEGIREFQFHVIQSRFYFQLHLTSIAIEVVVVMQQLLSIRTK